MVVHMQRFVFFLCLALPVTASAEPRASDQVFDAEGLAAHLSGQIIEFFDGSKSRFDEDRRYGYTYTDDGPVWEGAWRTDAESRVCVDFDNGSSRCDHIVLDGDRTVLIIEDGTRFPARSVTAVSAN